MKRPQVKIDWIGQFIDPYIPEYGTRDSSGADLRADIEQDIPITPENPILIPTGIRLKLPPGYEAQVRSRSGLAAKNGVWVLNSPGTIDGDYTGEIKVILATLDSFVVKPGMRIAQLVVQPVDQAAFVVEKFKDVDSRGSKGFGSTGV